ncbi:tetratricopeptide repeat protein [Rhizocola hellebori]|uniref:tetratricopeptide repeat protein n=1 Tax=Rhizocola hellebori TaxID=1392758 RepID=UPI001941913E|nr:tetratricopeptide repeat protein [Rhizocola hellebori]
MSDSIEMRAAGARTVDDLAEVLRALRHRHARHRSNGKVSYRGLAVRTGWSHTAIAEYLTGRTLPPPERLDTLVGLLGATPAEQGALATARDRIDELRRPGRPPIRPDAARPGTSVPRQLPAAPAYFVGRVAELAALTRLVDQPSGDAIMTPRQRPLAAVDLAGRVGEPATLNGRAKAVGTVAISAIGGTAGVGKTALAVYWAHRVADRFPDGQLYMDLRGFGPDGQVVAPAEAVRRFLDALDVPPEKIPADVDARAALYRSMLAGRRMLVVVDNARDSAQVRPLLPATAGCLVVVTSRNQLTGLVAADGAQLVDLDLLSVGEARELLARRLGTDRVAAEPAAVAEIIARCARLPIALALVAARAAARPRVALQVLADELADARQRWLTLTGDDPHTDMRAVFSWSYQALTRPAARLFRLLGLHSGPDITTPAAGSLTGLAPDDVRPLLAELTTASLLAEHRPGRYILHDLLYGYATHLAETVDTDQQRHAATGRILDHYLNTASVADRLLAPTRDQLQLAPPRAGVTPEQVGDPAQALEWFTAEHRVLLATVDLAAATGFDTHTCQLAWFLHVFLYRRGHWQDLLAAAQTAIAAAQRLADPTILIRTRRRLAGAYTRLGRLDDAYNELRQALDLATGTGDQAQQAHTHHSLATLWERRAQPAQALHHARQALQLYQTADHQTGQADALNSVGWYYTQLGEHQQALTYCQQALTLFEQFGDQFGQAGTWDSIGHAHHHLGQHVQALTCYQKALTLFQDLGDRYNEATILTHFGDTHHATGNSHAAYEAWQQALTILDDLDHPNAAQVRAKLVRDEGVRPASP